MAQKKGVTQLTDQLKGDVSEDRAIEDISRGIRDKLYHESIGFYHSATPKNIQGLQTILKPE